MEKKVFSADEFVTAQEARRGSFDSAEQPDRTGPVVALLAVLGCMVLFAIVARIVVRNVSADQIGLSLWTWRRVAILSAVVVVGAIVYFVKHDSRFRSDVSEVWGAVKRFPRKAWGWVLWPWLQLGRIWHKVRRLQKRIHDDLTECRNWYQDWHNWKLHGIVHCGVLFAALVATVCWLHSATKSRIMVQSPHRQVPSMTWCKSFGNFQSWKTDGAASGDGSIRLAWARKRIVVTTTCLGSNPTGMATGGDGMIYVAGISGSTVRKIDPATKKVVATISVGMSPYGMTTGADGMIYVANYGSSAVSKIDPSINAVVATTTVGSNPTGMATGGDGMIYVANSGDNTVSKIDPSTDAVEGSTTVGRYPIGMTTGADGMIYVANNGDNTVSAIDPIANTVVATISVCSNPVSVRTGADGMIYVAGASGNAVSKIDGAGGGYQRDGMATVTCVPKADQVNRWLSAQAVTSVPAGTNLVLEYSADGTSWERNVADVPSSKSLHIKVKFWTSNSKVSPALNVLTINYEPIQPEKKPK